MTTPAGWYDDGHGSLRWWDGAQWTNDARDPEAAADAYRADTDAAAALGFEPSPAVEPPATPPKRSLWWIWPVAGGVVVLVLAAIFIPMALGALTGGRGTSAGEQAAVGAVEDFDRAWQSVDCDLMRSVTTEGFREDFDLTDCEVFQDQALDLAATTSGYETTVTSVRTQDDGTVLVETTETYLSRFDDDGVDTGAEQEYSDDYVYLVVAVDGDWLVDDSAAG